MLVLQQANIAVRFVLEMVLLAAVGIWAWRLVSHPLLSAAAATAAVLAVATTWALVVHRPTAPPSARAGTQVAALMLGTLAIAHGGEAPLAAAVAVLAIVNAILLSLWDQ